MMRRSHYPAMNNTSSLPRGLVAALAAALAGTAALPAQAYDQTISGFGSVVAGKTFGGCQTADMATKYDSFCTRFIADYAHDGVYTPSVSATPESRLGLQWTGNFTSSLSATVQGMARLTDGQKADLEWAYLTDKINSSWTIQVGRKRLPLYYYSDFQDVGYAYTMIRPSSDVYGWDVVNYDGANVDYSTDLGDWSLRASVYGGAENSRKNKFAQTEYDSPVDVKWKDIAGGSVEISRDWFTARLTYTQSKFQEVDHDSGQPMPLATGANTGTQNFYGLALIADYDDWVGRAELAGANRRGEGEDLHYFYVNAGRRFGKFTPMLQFSEDHETTTVAPIYRWVNRTASVAVRYEVNKSSDLKLQVDRDMESRGAPFTGSANVVSMSYDFVF